MTLTEQLHSKPDDDENSELQEKYSQMQHNLTRLQASETNLKNELQKEINEKGSMLKKLETLEVENDNQTKLMSELEKSKLYYQNEVQKETQEKSALIAKLDILERDYESQKDLMSKMNEDESSSKQQIEVVTMQMAEMSEKAETAITELKFQIQEMTGKIEQHAIDKTKAESLIMELDVQIEQMSSQIDQLTAEKSNLEADYITQKDLMTKMNDDGINSKQQVEMVTMQMAQLSEKAENTIADLKKQIKEMTSKSDQLTIDKTNLFESFNKLKIENEDQKKLIGELEESEEYYKELVELVTKQKNEEISTLKSKIDNTDSAEKLQKAVRERDQIQENFQSLQAAFKTLQDRQENYDQLVADNDKLELQLKDLENSDNQVYIKSLREKMASQHIELASLRTDQIKAQGETQKKIKRLSDQLDGQMIENKKLKNEIRKLSQVSHNLDSTYVATNPTTTRPPLQDRPVESVCSNCQNVLNNVPTTPSSAMPKNKKLIDDKAYMNYDPNDPKYGFYSYGSGALKDLFVDQAKTKTTQLEKDLAKKQKEVTHYIDTASKWKGRTLSLQDKIKECERCKSYVEKY